MEAFQACLTTTVLTIVVMVWTGTTPTDVIQFIDAVQNFVGNFQ